MKKKAHDFIGPFVWFNEGSKITRYDQRGITHDLVPFRDAVIIVGLKTDLLHHGDPGELLTAAGALVKPVNVVGTLNTTLVRGAHRKEVIHALCFGLLEHMMGCRRTLDESLISYCYRVEDESSD